MPTRRLMTPAPQSSDFAHIITPIAPFGPFVTEGITNEVAFQALFDRENSAHLGAMTQDPSFIIGRRGAGKTAFLRAPSTHDGSIPVLFDQTASGKVFGNVHMTVRAFENSGHAIFTAHVTDLWEACLWNAALLGLYQYLLALPGPVHDQDLNSLHNYLSGFIPEPASAGPQEAVARFCQGIQQQVANGGSVLADAPDSFVGGPHTLAQMRTLATACLARHRKDVLILLDSMEDFDRIMVIGAETMEGLLALAGQRRRDKNPFSLRICIPAEQYHPIKEMSRNDVKDFASYILLHWSASDLIRVVARRFSIFLHLHHSEQLKDLGIYPSFTEDSKESERLLRWVLPEKISGPSGESEDAIAFLIRHTQLMPRHLVLILNTMWDLMPRAADGALPSVPEDVVKAAVLAARASIVSEICKAYRPVHASVDASCQAVIPHLESVFSHAQLHKVFTQHGRAVYDGLDIRTFKRMLIEIGAVGRFVKETGRYIEAEFEYTAPNRLAVSESEQLCLHPLFAGEYDSVDAQPTFAGQTKPVYPSGWELNGPGFRERGLR